MKNENSYSLSRRELLAAGTAAMSMLAVPAITYASGPGNTVNKHLTGIQLYTVRAAMEKDLPGTLKAIAGMGYKLVEFAGYFNTPPAEVRRLLEDLGLKSPSGHVPSTAIRDNPMPLIEMAAEVGHEYITLGWLSPDDRQNLDQYKAWAETCNKVGEACQQHGLRFAWHNHDFELLPLNGTIPFDILLQETDPSLVDFELDFYWARKAGQSVSSVLAKSPERFTMAHIKDMDSEGNMVDVGAGDIDFASILADPSASGIKYLFAEHDNPSDPFKTAAISQYALASIVSGSVVHKTIDHQK